VSENEARVGVVDDEISLVRTYELLFKHKNIPVCFVALDGREALKKFQVSDPKPKVMIIDYRLPFASGIEVMLEIRKIAPETKTIIISADGEIGEEALKNGATLFFKKPVRTKVMIDSIISLLNS